MTEYSTPQVTYGAATDNHVSGQRQLRFAIMCNSTTFPSWQASCLQNLLALPYVEPVLLVIHANPPIAPQSLWQKVKALRRLNDTAYTVFFDRFVRPRSKALMPVDLASPLSNIPTLHCKVINRGRFSAFFAEQDVAAIRGYHLDFMLRFGFGIIRGEILNVARYGVWSFHHADEQKYRGGPACFWEIYHGDPSVGSILQRLTNRLDAGAILRKGSFTTIQHSYSRSLDRVYFGTSDWPARVCHDIFNDSAPYVDGKPSSSVAPIYQRPNLVQLLRFLLKLAVAHTNVTLRGLLLGSDREVKDVE